MEPNQRENKKESTMSSGDTAETEDGKCSHIIHDKIIHFDNIKFYFLKV